MAARPPRNPQHSLPLENAELLSMFGKTAFAVKRWLRGNLPTDEGMTVPRASLLLRLTSKGDSVSMSELGELLGQSPRGMTVLVDGLEKEGLIRRRPHGVDRRITLVEMTSAGKLLADEKLGPSQKATAALFDDLTAAERAELGRLLTKLIGALRARGIEVPDAEVSE